MGFKLKRPPLSPAEELARNIEGLASVLDVYTENGVLAQGAVGLSAETRERLLTAIDHAASALARTRRVLMMVATLSAQLRDTPPEVDLVEGHLEEDDMHIRLRRGE